MTEIQRGSFESLVSRPDTHVVLDLETPGDALLIVFGGIAGGVSMPVFEFFRMASTIGARKAFLRDPRRAWYQLGIPGVGDTAGAVRDYLQAMIARAGAPRTVMAGASAGGFAALLFGVQCAVDEVIAFSPQTFIDAGNRARTGDHRWQEQIDAMHLALGTAAATLDLRDVLPCAPGSTRFHVHVSTDDELDLVHAQHIADRGGVAIVEHDRGGHRLVKTLRDRGVLRPLLLEALAGHHANDAL